MANQDRGPLQAKRGSAADWAATTVPLLSGEWGYDETNGVAKIGDGGTLWPDLPVPDVGLEYDPATGLFNSGGGNPVPSVDPVTNRLPVAVSRANQPQVNVLDYGAKRDGSDDTVAFQQAVDYLASVGGGTLFVPKGTYGIDAYKGDQAVYANGVRGGIRAAANVVIRGEGMFSTILKNIADQSTSLIQNRGVSGWGMEDLQLDVDWPNKSSAELSFSSTRGEAIIYWNGAAPANDNFYRNVLVRNTGHYAFGIQNVEVNRLLIESCFGQNIGGDFIDIKEFTAGGGAPAYPKTAIKVTNCWADRIGLNATVAQQEADAAAFDFRGEIIATNIHVYNLDTYNEPVTGNPMPSVVGIRVNGDVVANNRLGGRKVRVIGFSVTSSKAANEGISGGPKQIIGVRVGSNNSVISGGVVDNCYIGYRIIQTGDSNPSGSQIVGCHALNCRGSDGLGKGVSIEGAGTSMGSVLDVTAVNCDIGLAATNSLGAIGRFSFSGNTLDHNLTAAQLLVNLFTFASPANLVTALARATRTNFNDMTIWAQTGPTIRLRSVQDGSWTAPFDDGAVSFETEDTSGAGAGVRAELRARMTGSTGGGTVLVLRTNGGAGMTDVLTATAAGAVFNLALVPVATSDSDAGAKGVVVGGVYRNSSGNLIIKTT